MVARTWPALTLWLLASASGADPEVETSVEPTPETARQRLDAVVVHAPEAERGADADDALDPTASSSRVEVAPEGARPRDAAAVLRGVAGVQLRRQGGLGNPVTVSVRGASPVQVRVELDGIPLGGAGGLADLSLIPSVLLDRAEVIRGAGEARHGSGLGGRVRLRSSVGAGEHLRLEAGHGSFNSWNGAVAAGGRTPVGRLSLIAHGQLTDGDFSYPFDPLPALDGNPLDWRRRRNNDTRLGGGLLRWEQGRLEAVTHLSVVDRGLSGTVANPSPDARQRALDAAAAFTARGELGWLEHRVRAWARRRSDDFDALPYLGELSQRLTLAGLSARAEGSWARGHRSHADVELGASALEVEGGASTGWVSGSLGLGHELLVAGDRLLVTPALRLSQTGPYTHAAASLGARWRVGADAAIDLNVGHSTRPPSFLELHVRQGALLPNPDLRPERSLYVDAALWSNGGAPLRPAIRLGAFASLYEDLIAYELYPPFASKPFNFGAALIAGAELEARWRPLAWLGGSLAYTLMGTRNLRDDWRHYGRPLPNRPVHAVAASLTAGPSWALLGVDVTAQSEQLRNRTAELVLPGRILLDVRLESRLWERPDLTVSLELSNLLDVHTEDLAGYPLPGRSAFIAVRWAMSADDATAPTSNLDRASRTGPRDLSPKHGASF